MLSKKKKIILSIGTIISLGLITIGFFSFKEKKEIIKEETAEKFRFLTDQEKEEYGIDKNLKVKVEKIKSKDLGPISIIELPKSEIKDQDQDGLSDEEEEKLGTDPKKRDSDEDGIDDQDEIRIGTDPRNPDSDGDGISDGEEAKKS